MLVFIRHMNGSEVQLYNGVLAMDEYVYLSASVYNKKCSQLSCTF